MTTDSAAARQRLEAAGVPAALLDRPIDQRRALPVPYVNEHPAPGDSLINFASINGERALTCAREKRCGACGQPLGYWIAFLGGPQAAQHRAYLDPPMHETCAVAATRLCPHLALRRHRRAPEHRLAPDTVTPPGFAEDKPDRWILGITRSYRPALVGGTLVFRPAPFVRRRVFAYGDDGRLAEQDTETTRER